MLNIYRFGFLIILCFIKLFINIVCKINVNYFIYGFTNHFFNIC